MCQAWLKISKKDVKIFIKIDSTKVGKRVPPKSLDSMQHQCKTSTQLHSRSFSHFILVKVSLSLRVGNHTTKLKC